MIFKVLYNFRRPFWCAYGHVLYIEADPADVVDVAQAAAQAAHLDAEIFEVTATPATEAQRVRHFSRVAASRQWALNVLHGIPNKRGAL